MKTVWFAYITAAIVTAIVFINSALIGYNIDELTKQIEAAPNSAEAGDVYKAIYDDYMKREQFIALSITHSDLVGIEESFSEITGAIEAEDDESLLIAKSRLVRSLKHIKRLSGVNFDSIF